MGRKRINAGCSTMLVRRYCNGAQVVVRFHPSFLSITFKIENDMSEFYYKGHHYKVVPIEDSTDSNIVKDGKFVRRVSKEIASNAMQNVDRLFK